MANDRGREEEQVRLNKVEEERKVAAKKWEN